MSSVLPQESEATHRRFTLRHLSIALVVIGLLITGYLSYEHHFKNNIACIGGSTAFDCDAVNSSIYSEFMGIYVGYLGLAADAFLFAVLVLEPHVGVLRDYGVIIVFAVVLLAWLYHDYLTYVSFTNIQRLCIWCLGEHTLMTLLLIVTCIRLYREFIAGSQA